MVDKRLERWANLLLDTGKRNNLINYRDTRGSSVEVLLPETGALLSKTESSALFEVFDPQLTDAKLSREEYLATYGPKLKKAGHLLLFHEAVPALAALKNIHKKARSAMEETGVNVAYMVFGFIHWFDEGHEYRAPLLLAPVLFRNDSAISPYYIRMTEDDVIVNPTFSYKLEAEHGVTLPVYEDEPLTEYIEKIAPMLSRLGMTVSEECRIGIFSFLKLNMYQDLVQNAGTILKNNNVRMLVGESFTDQSAILESGAHHLANPLIQCHNVVDADSSQLEAIEMAKAGVSFVLQGPPGTGKSQTITNIIAEALSDGRKVLFVSEKQAALNVVHDKLKKAGLEEFCLELHSYKANKKDVIAELVRTLRAPGHTLSGRADEEIGLKQRAQRTLDDYDRELHREQEELRCSLYELYERYLQVADAPDTGISIHDLTLRDEVYRRAAVDVLDRYREASEGNLDYRSRRFFGYVNTDTSYQTLRLVREDMEQLAATLPEMIPAVAAAAKTFEIPLPCVEDVRLWQEFCSEASDSRYLTPELLRQKELPALLSVLKDLKVRSAGVRELRDRILAEYDRDILEMDGKITHRILESNYESFWSRLVSKEYKTIIGILRSTHQIGWKPTYEDALQFTAVLEEYQSRLANFCAVEEPVMGLFGREYAGVDTDWDRLLAEVEAVRAASVRGCDFGRLARAESLGEAEKSELRECAHEMKAILAPVLDAAERLAGSFDARLVDLMRIPLRELHSRMEGCLAEFDSVKSWSNLWELVQEVRQRDLGGFLDAAIRQDIPAGELTRSYLRSFYYQWMDHVIHATPVLSKFSRVSQDKTVDTFCEKDQLQFAVNRARIRAELSEKRPSVDLLFKGSAVQVLLREGEKKRKQKSIRRLFSEVGELVQVLKPCFLMSPLSVSTFLNTEDIRFDVVIFDEASQIFPQDALGAIYRGKQLIVVGDSRQMPPSNFFTTAVTSEDEDDEIEDVSDFESILDLCSTTLPQLRLKWHYRSRYEELIAFSNRNFYDGDLVTFPSPGRDSMGVGVDYYDAGGTFEHRSRTNRGEAEFVVERIYRNFIEHPERSLGVVAFSIAQQDLIERLLAKKRQEDPSLEEYFRTDRPEPFFIKNLETVQGDERDTIIFSVAYAKDEQGKLLHNFGPLNRVGGERRLNVAVTRARINVQLVASIHHGDIDGNRAHSEGARLLKEYLKFAEFGAPETAVPAAGDLKEEASFLEEDIASCLREAGYVVDRSVGFSSFRVDLAVRRPDREDYCLAIECDGATYHSGRNARDRDRLRPSILERMGWNYYRIWSTDWIRNREQEKKWLLAAAADACREEEAEPETGDASGETGDFETSGEKHTSPLPVYEMIDARAAYEAKQDLPALLGRIIEQEAPVSEEWLMKRICFIFGRTKVTTAVQNEYEKAVEAVCRKVGAHRRGGFIYREGQTDFVLRVPAGEEKRELRYIAPEELAAGIMTICRQSIRLEKEDLFAALAKLVGYSRTGEAMEASMEKALDLLDDVIRVDGDTVHLREDEPEEM